MVESQKREKHITVFYSYSQVDKALLIELDKRMSMLRRQGLISTTYEERAYTELEMEQRVRTQLDSAQVILLLVSPDYLYEDQCYVQMMQATQKAKQGTAHVLAIFARPTPGWEDTPIIELEQLPANRRPITLWSNRDLVYADIVAALRRVFDRLRPIHEVFQPMYRRINALLPLHHPRAICQRDGLTRVIYSQLIQKDASMVVLTGLPGAGKSTLAALVWEYAEEQRRNSVGPFKGEALWLKINSTTTLIDLLGTLRESLGESTLDYNALTVHNLLNELIILLRYHNTPRLIILDEFDTWLNIQTGEAQREQVWVTEWIDSMNNEPSRCRLLLTSHLWSPAMHVQVCVQKVVVPGFSEDEGRQLLRLWGIRGSNDELALAVKLCNGHASALVALSQMLHDKGLRLSTLLNDSKHLHVWVKGAGHGLFEEIYTHQLNASQRDLLFTFAIYRNAVPFQAIKVIIATQKSLAKEQLPVLLSALQNRNLLLSLSTIDPIYELHPIIAESARTYFMAKAEHTNNDIWCVTHSHAASYYLNQFKLRKQAQRHRVEDVYGLIEATWHYCQAGCFQEAYELIVKEHIFTDMQRWGRNAIVLELYEALLNWQPGDERAACIYDEIGEIYNALGQKDKALHAFQHAVALFKHYTMRVSEAKALDHLGMIYRAYGQLQQALTYYQEALRICEDGEEEVSQHGSILHNLGKVFLSLGQNEENPDVQNECYSQALTYYEQALAVHRTKEDRVEEARTLNNIGEMYDNLGEYDRAYQFYKDALDLFLGLEQRRDEGIVCNNLGVYYRNKSNYTEAFEYYSQALVIYQEIGDRWEEVKVLRNIGRLFGWMQCYDISLACYWLAREIGDSVYSHTDYETVPIGVRLGMGEEHFKQTWSEVKLNAEQLVEQVLREGITEGKRRVLPAVPEQQDNSARLPEPPAIVEKEKGRDMIKILFLAANPLDTDRLVLEKEYREITETIRMSRYRDNLNFSSAWAVNRSSLLKELNYHQPQIVHFSGHGSAQGGLQLYEEGDSSLSVELGAQHLKDIFHAWRGNTRLVILNACYAEIQAKLISGEIDCVIGMKDEIHDEAASVFVGALYDAIGSGLSIQTAFDQGITKLRILNMSAEHIPALHTKTGVDANQVKLITGRHAPQWPNSQNSQGGNRYQAAVDHPTDSTITKLPILPKAEETIPIYCSYAKQDQKFYDTLKTHLSIMLQRGLIRIWGTEDLSGGSTQETVLEQLRMARIVLLFVSPNFFKPERNDELALALALREQGTVRVIPIILRRTAGWKDTPFERFSSLPREKEAVSLWPDRDEAFYSIAQDIRTVVEEELSKS